MTTNKREIENGRAIQYPATTHAAHRDHVHTAPTDRTGADDAARCRRVLHIDWDGDPTPVREDVARCVLPIGHAPKRHEGQDASGSWFRW